MRTGSPSADAGDGGASATGSNPRRSSSPTSALHAAARPGASAGLGPPHEAGVGRVVGVGPEALGHRREQAGEQRVGGRIEAEPGGARRQEVVVLGPPDGAPVDGLGLDETGLAEPLEVEPDGVRVQAERIGEFLGRQGRGRGGQLAVHRVPGLVAQGLEDLEVEFHGFRR